MKVLFLFLMSLTTMAFLFSYIHFEHRLSCIGLWELLESIPYDIGQKLDYTLNW